MKSFITLCSIFIIMNASSALALSIDIFQAGDLANIASWKTTRGGQVTVLENFETQTAGWYTSLHTGVGTFTADGEAGTGDTSYNAVHAASLVPYFSIQNQSGDWYGRYDTTDGLNGSMNQWLDSGDITLLHLTGIDSALTNLFFYMQDPSDVGATTNVGVSTFLHDFSSNIYSGQSDGASFFVGITLDAGEILNELSWKISTINDGFGVDNFSTVAPVPEPATMLLFGTGLIGLSRIARKKKK